MLFECFREGDMFHESCKEVNCPGSGSWSTDDLPLDPPSLEDL